MPGRLAYGLLCVVVAVGGGVVLADEAGVVDAPDLDFGTDLNETAIEQRIHRSVNDQRYERGLTRLDHDTELAAIARSHSEDMAARDYYAHASPEGRQFEDRYAAAGYECRVPTGSGEYFTGAENINLVNVESFSEEEIAEKAVTQWMNSKGHRENILNQHWRRQGIGVNVTTGDDGRTDVYITQNFC